MSETLAESLAEKSSETASTDSEIIANAKRVIDIEREALLDLRNRIDNDFVEACELLLACKGRVIVSGMGKSGHIAKKIAATMASTGTPSFFVHPGEAAHGDLGMIVASKVLSPSRARHLNMK